MLLSTSGKLAELSMSRQSRSLGRIPPFSPPHEAPSEPPPPFSPTPTRSSSSIGRPLTSSSSSGAQQPSDTVNKSASMPNLNLGRPTTTANERSRPQQPRSLRPLTSPVGGMAFCPPRLSLLARVGRRGPHECGHRERMNALRCLAVCPQVVVGKTVFWRSQNELDLRPLFTLPRR